MPKIQVLTTLRILWLNRTGYWSSLLFWSKPRKDPPKQSFHKLWDLQNLTSLNCWGLLMTITHLKCVAYAFLKKRHDVRWNTVLGQCGVRVCPPSFLNGTRHLMKRFQYSPRKNANRRWLCSTHFEGRKNCCVISPHRNNNHPKASHYCVSPHWITYQSLLNSTFRWSLNFLRSGPLLCTSDTLR